MEIRWQIMRGFESANRVRCWAQQVSGIRWTRASPTAAGKLWPCETEKRATLRERYLVKPTHQWAVSLRPKRLWTSETFVTQRALPKYVKLWTMWNPDTSSLSSTRPHRQELKCYRVSNNRVITRRNSQPRQPPPPKHNRANSSSSRYTTAFKPCETVTIIQHLLMERAEFETIFSLARHVEKKFAQEIKNTLQQQNWLVYT